MSRQEIIKAAEDCVCRDVLLNPAQRCAL